MFLSKLLANFKQDIFPSKINGTIYVGKSFGKKALFASNIPQSGGEFIRMWQTVIKILKDRRFNPKNCLMLGVAGGTAITSLQKTYPRLSITGVELDSEIVKLAHKNHFFQIDQNTKINIADALIWVKKDSKKYDLIVIDLYIGDQNPHNARQKPFLLQVKKLLKQKGIILYNCHYSKDKENEYLNFRKITDQIFESTEEIFEFPKNKILCFQS